MLIDKVAAVDETLFFPFFPPFYCHDAISSLILDSAFAQAFRSGFQLCCMILLAASA